MRFRSLLSAALLLPTLGAVAAAPAVTHARISLLGTADGFLHWSSTANDPEAAVAEIREVCSYPPVYSTPNAGVCLSGPPLAGGSFLHTLFFAPGAILDEELSWTAGDAPRFHLELGTDIPLTGSVSMVLQQGATVTEAPAATLVAPGVYEGTLGAGTLAPHETVLVGVRIRTSIARLTVTLRAAGASYIDLGRPVAMRSVPELLAASTYAPSPSQYATSQRSFSFNDADWNVSEYAGDLGATRSISLQLDAPTPVVLAWVDLFEDPVIADTVRTGALDRRRIDDTPVMRMYLDGEEIFRGPNHTAMRGRGMETAAAVNIGPGALRIDVIPSSTSATTPYVARVLTAGVRTIASMRWRFHAADTEPLIAHRSPTSGFCPAASEVVPATDAVTSLKLDLAFSTVNPVEERWTFRYSIPGIGPSPCGEGGRGTSLRMTYPGARVYGVGPVPSRDGLFASHRMTTFTIEARFAYNAP